MSLLPPDSSRERIPSKRILRDDTKFASGKIAFFQYFSVGVFLFLISGFWRLQVRDPEIYNEAAERNRIKFVPLLAPRGKILDRDGRVIVDNRSSFSLMLSREHLQFDHIRPIALGLGLDVDQLQTRVARFRSRPKYENIFIKNELTSGEVAFVAAHRDPDTFPELDLIQAQRRLYPQNQVAAHAIGYVGEISESELNLPEFIKYDQGAVIGKAGLEREYNDQLMGVDGQKQVVVDNRGTVRESLGIKEAIPGKNLQLTLDLDLQAVAELTMQNRTGAVVALDPRNGEVLAMVSTPAYDPNKFAGRIHAADWNELRNNPDNPLLNRAIQAQFAPGSTFKPFVALAGLETGAIDENFTIHCPGGAMFYGRYFKCHLKGGHGSVSLHKGIAQSCDVYFYNVGNRTGIDNIARYADMAGFGHKTGIDLPNEAQGVVPSSEWKMRNFRQKWYAGETISVAIGQGAVTITPLQLAYAMGGLAMGGVWYQPHLVKDAEKARKPRLGKVDPEAAQKIVSGMYAVINEGGTGIRARLPGISVCGKTGSAQRISNELAKAGLGHKIKDNAWFVGFAPCEAPEITVSVLWEGGVHGQFAAAIARDVIKAYFDKKARLSQNHFVAEMKRSQPQFGLLAPQPPSQP